VHGIEGSTAGFGQLVRSVERAARIGRDAKRSTEVEVNVEDEPDPTIETPTTARDRGLSAPC